MLPLARFPTAMAAIEGVEPLPLTSSKAGPPTATINEKSLHSSYDPIREAQKFAVSQNLTPGAKVFLYGVGLGYALPPLLDSIGADGRLVVAEPNASALATAVTLVDPDIWADDRLTLVSGRTEEEFLAELSRAFASLGDGVTVALWPPSVATAPTEWQGVRTAIDLIRMERRFTHVMGDAEGENHAANLPRLLNERGVATLTGFLNGAPAYIVGAGPSLDRDIVHLAAAKGRAFIITSDTAYPALLAQGIVPDMVVSVDPQPATMNHFQLASRFDLPLVVLPTVATALVERWEGPLFVGFRGVERYPAELADWIANDVGILTAGGSVSATALELALLMGAGSVICVGQDFCYPAGRSYASGTVMSLLNRGWLPTDDLRHDVDPFGRQVLSTLNLYSYRRTFEEVATTATVPLRTLSMYAPPLAHFALGPAPLIGPPPPPFAAEDFPRLAAPPVIPTRREPVKTKPPTRGGSS